MSTNDQPIPQGLIAAKPVADFMVEVGGVMEPGDTDFQSVAFIFAPSVFIDGLLLTYEVRSDRRYVSFNSSTQTITINNGGVNEGENVQIFY